MLIGECIQRVKHAYNKGVENNDSRLSNRYVYSRLKTVRSLLLSQEVKKKQAISDWSYQTIPCLPLIVAPSHECPCVPAEGCEILRSQYKLPEIFTDNNSHIIKSMSKITGTGSDFLDIQFDETTWMRVKYQGGSKFAAKKSKFYIHNGYLYITHNKTLKVLSIVALFSDPLQAAIAPSFCEEQNVNNCKSYLEYDIHIDGKLEKALIDLTVEEIVYVFSQMGQDKTNNADDSTGANIPNPRSYRDVNKNVNLNDN